MVLQNSNRTEKLGIRHYFFQQYYKGFPIEGARYVVHQKNGRVYAANGIIVTDINTDSQSKITKNQALQYALQALPGKYDWNDTTKNDSFYLPKVELLFTLNRIPYFRMFIKMK